MFVYHCLYITVVCENLYYLVECIFDFMLPIDKKQTYKEASIHACPAIAPEGITVAEPVYKVLKLISPYKTIKALQHYSLAWTITT